jgi:electron transfer flavoprotein alpha subunit
MANSIFVYIDHFEGNAVPASWEAIAAANAIADQMEGGVSALVLGHNVQAIAQEAIANGAATVLVADDAGLEDFKPESYATIVSQALKVAAAEVLLAPNTGRTKELVAMVAVDLETGVAPDVTEMEVEDGTIIATRPIYAGKLLTKVACRERRPQILTLRSRAFPKPEPDESRTGEISPLSTEGVEFKSEVLGYKESEGGVSLADAAIIVSGGRGVSNNPNLEPPADLTDEKEIEIWRAQQGFALVRELADVLGAAVGASRAAVDAGYIPYANQVGQTGKVVTPDLYIACGISGAIQHLAGMRTAKTIVAINKDPDAPIFKLARFGVVGDLFDILPPLAEELKARLNT